MQQSIFRRVYQKLMGHPRYRWAVIIASGVYLLSPLDFSPDIFPIVGWIDDGFIAALLATEVTQLLLDRRQSMRDQKAQELEGGDEPEREA
jgi:uncharacterized membrane protein YkvA (DUF1232 family)